MIAKIKNIIESLKDKVKDIFQNEETKKERWKVINKFRGESKNFNNSLIDIAEKENG